VKPPQKKKKKKKKKTCALLRLRFVHDRGCPGHGLAASSFVAIPKGGRKKRGGKKKLAEQRGLFAGGGALGVRGC